MSADFQVIDGVPLLHVARDTPRPRIEAQLAALSTHARAALAPSATTTAPPPLAFLRAPHAFTRALPALLPLPPLPPPHRHAAPTAVARVEPLLVQLLCGTAAARHQLDALPPAARRAAALALFELRFVECARTVRPHRLTLRLALDARLRPPALRRLHLAVVRASAGQRALSLTPRSKVWCSGTPGATETLANAPLLRYALAADIAVLALRDGAVSPTQSATKMVACLTVAPAMLSLEQRCCFELHNTERSAAATDKAASSSTPVDQAESPAEQLARWARGKTDAADKQKSGTGSSCVLQ